MQSLMLALVLAADPTVSIITLGAHHGGDVKALGSGWLGLFAARLAPVELKIKKVHDPIDDDGKPAAVRSGVEISVDGEEQPIMLLRGLESRAVKAIAFTPGGALEVGKPLALGEASLSAVDEKQIVLTQGAQRQVLYAQKSGDTDGWMLHWAGDLDGDGKLDLILAADHHYNRSTLRVFLSSRAKKGQLVREVAKFSTTGC